MPKYQITSPDGAQFEVTAPDGASEADVMAYAQSQFHQPKPAAPEVDFSGNLQVGPIDTGIALPPAANKRLAQLGSGLADWVTGVRQRLGLATTADAAEKRTLDQKLNDDFTGKALNFAGKVAPAFAVPASGFVGGVAGGALMGAAEPTVEGESATKNALIGGALGGALPAIGAGVRWMVKPTAETAALGRKAIEHGIPIGPADLSSNKLVKATRSVLNDTPFIGAISGAQNKAKQEAFSKAVGKTFGADAKSLTPDVMEGAKGAIGAELNRIWNGNTLKLDAGMMDDFTRIGERASSLNPDQQATVIRQMQNLLQKADGAEIPGGFTNNWQSELRLAIEGEKGLAKDVLNDLRQSTIRAFNRGVAPEDAAALTLARRQYVNWKAVNPLTNKSAVGVAGREVGDIAGQLPGAVAQKGTPELKELAAIGSKFLADRTLQTGGSPRAMLQNGIIGSMLTASGGLDSLGLGLLTAAGSAATNKALGSPRLGKSLLTPAARGLLDEPALTPAMLEAMRKSIFLSVAGAPATLKAAPLE